ncbi:will die slowly [Carabus blaptoides fortunei]
MELIGDVKGIKTILSDRNVLCVKYTDSRKSIAAGCIDGTVNLYDVKTHEHEIALVDTDTKHIDNAVTAISHSPLRSTQTLTCSYSGGVIKLWDIRTGQCMFSIKENREILGVLHHPSQPRFITYGDDAKINLYDMETQTLEAIYQSSVKLKVDGHSNKIFSACFHPTNGYEFVTGGWDKNVHFWDMRAPSSSRFISDVFICGDGLTINPVGTELVSCEWNKENSLRIWNYSTGKLIQSLILDGYKSQLYCGKYMNKFYLAVGGSNENIFRLVDRKMKSTVGSVRGLANGVCSLDILPLEVPKTKRHESVAELRHILPVVFCDGRNIHEVRFH